VYRELYIAADAGERLVQSHVCEIHTENLML